jgi:hypothetical protein
MSSRPRATEDSLRWTRELDHANTTGFVLCFGVTITNIWLRRPDRVENASEQPDRGSRDARGSMPRSSRAAMRAQSGWLRFRAKVIAIAQFWFRTEGPVSTHCRTLNQGRRSSCTLPLKLDRVGAHPAALVLALVVVIERPGQGPSISASWPANSTYARPRTTVWGMIGRRVPPAVLALAAAKRARALTVSRRR